MIETTRLILRPFREEDAADVFEYLEKPTVNCFACMKLNSLEEAQAAVKEKMAHSEYCFAIVLKDTGKVIGEIDADGNPIYENTYQYAILKKGMDNSERLNLKRYNI